MPTPVSIIIPNTPVKSKINILPAPVTPFYRPPSIVIPSPHIATPSRHQSKPIVVSHPVQPKPMVVPYYSILPVTPAKPDPVVIPSLPEVV